MKSGYWRIALSLTYQRPLANGGSCLNLIGWRSEASAALLQNHVDLSDYWKSGTWDIIEVPAYLNVHNDTGTFIIYHRVLFPVLSHFLVESSCYLVLFPPVCLSARILLPSFLLFNFLQDSPWLHTFCKNYLLSFILSDIPQGSSRLCSSLLTFCENLISFFPLF